jgi:2-keto-3-deoxy-L-rhamnonate aldolase RhmA
VTATVGANKLKRKLIAGELALIAGNYESSDMIDFVGSLGFFDGVWIDMEHGSVAMNSLPDMSRAADLWGMTSVVRVSSIDPAIIALTLSQGVNGVIVPHVNTGDDAELVVDAAKFPPVGHRGAGAGRRSYGRGTGGYERSAEDDTFVAVMIEDVIAVNNLPEILEVPNIDLFFIGRYDLAQSLGLESDVRHPDLVKAFDGAIETIVKAGKVAGAVISEKDLDKYLSMGVRCLKTPTWQTFIAGAARSFVDSVEAAKS